MTKILYVSASARAASSQSRKLGDQLVAKLVAQHPGAAVVERNVAQDMPFVSEESIAAAFTPESTRTPAQQALLAFSDALIDELLAADVVVIATPMYNFSAPASLKAWIDMIIRPERTYQKKDGAPPGLVSDRPVHIVITSGGVPMGSPYDHLTPLLRSAFGYMGITSLEFIYAAGTSGANVAQVIKDAEAKIEQVAA